MFLFFVVLLLWVLLPFLLLGSYYVYFCIRFRTFLIRQKGNMLCNSSHQLFRGTSLRAQLLSDHLWSRRGSSLTLLYSAQRSHHFIHWDEGKTIEALSLVVIHKCSIMNSYDPLVLAHVDSLNVTYI